MAPRRSLVAAAVLSLSVALVAAITPTAGAAPVTAPTLRVPSMAAAATARAARRAVAAAAAAHPLARGVATGPATTLRAAAEGPHGDFSEELQAELIQELTPLWEAFKAGKLDGLLEDFKAGRLDDELPTEAEVLKEFEKVMAFIRRAVPVVYTMLEELKAGKLDEMLAKAKEGTLEEALQALCEHFMELFMRNI